MHGNQYNCFVIGTARSKTKGFFKTQIHFRVLACKALASIIETRSANSFSISELLRFGSHQLAVCRLKIVRPNIRILLSILHPWRTAGVVQEGILPGQFAGRGHHVDGLLKLPSSSGPHQTGSNPTPSRLSLFSPMRSLRTEHACLRK